MSVVDFVLTRLVKGMVKVEIIDRINENFVVLEVLNGQFGDHQSH